MKKDGSLFMKRNIIIKMILVMILSLSIGLGSSTVQAAGTDSISDGTYTAGEGISAGLTEFSITRGTAIITITRDTNEIINETLSDDGYMPTRFTVRLKAGDKIESNLYDGASTMDVRQIPKVDLRNISAGYYEIGTDIPAGTYALDIDRPSDDYDVAYINILDDRYNRKDSLNLFNEEDPYEYRASEGEKIYISSLVGTMSFKEKILVPKSITLSKPSLSLLVSQTAQLKATVYPNSAINKSVSWTVGDPRIATVDVKGNVKALKAGRTTITATADGDASIKKASKLQ